MITIVLGMHRSGTSVVAGILHFNKITMGTYETFWPRPLPQNPKGFYENYDFRKINDTLLQKSGYNIKHYKTNIPILWQSEKAFSSFSVNLFNIILLSTLTPLLLPILPLCSTRP